MESLYLENEIVKSDLKSFALLSEELFLKQDITTSKRGGLNEITDLRDKIAILIDRPIGQVMKLTKNWSKYELYLTLHAAEQFTQNPPACWWVLYKKNKDTYGKTKKRTLKKGLQQLGEKRRVKNITKRQGLLF